MGKVKSSLHVKIWKKVKLVAKIIIKKLFNVNAKNIKVKMFLKL